MDVIKGKPGVHPKAQFLHFSVVRMTGGLQNQVNASNDPPLATATPRPIDIGFQKNVWVLAWVCTMEIRAVLVISRKRKLQNAAVMGMTQGCALNEVMG